MTYICTSANIIQLNEWGCRDGMHHAKTMETRKSPSNTIKDTYVTLCLNKCREGLYMIVLVSLIVLLWGIPCFYDFSHGASHLYIPIHSVLMNFLMHLFRKMFRSLFVIRYTEKKCNNIPLRSLPFTLQK